MRRQVHLKPLQDERVPLLHLSGAIQMLALELILLPLVAPADADVAVERHGAGGHHRQHEQKFRKHLGRSEKRFVTFSRNFRFFLSGIKIAKDQNLWWSAVVAQR